MIQVINPTMPDRFENGSGGMKLVLSSETAISLFEGLAVRYNDLANNDLQLMQLQAVGNQSKVRWGSLTPMQHVLSARKAGCTGGSKGSMHMNVDEADMNPIEYKGKFCPDILWDNCLEQIFGAGNDIRNLLGTDKGRTLWGMITKGVFNAIGNGIHELAWYGSHPSIAKSIAGNWFAHGKNELNPGDLQDFKNFVDQQEASTGFITLMEQIRAIGSSNKQNFKVTMESGVEIDATTGKWIGNPVTFFKKMLDNSTTRLSLLIDSLQYGFLPNIVVTKDIFESYKTYLQVNYPGLQAGYEYRVKGVDGQLTTARNVLLWEGFKVIYINESKKFDTIVGTDTTSAFLAYPNVLGFAYDTPLVANRQYQGAGLIIQFNDDVHGGGEVKLRTDFKISSTILDQDLITYSSFIRTPTA